MIPSIGHRWQVPLLLLTIALTRPEGVMVFVVWLAYRLWTGKKHCLTIKMALIFVIFYSTFILWRWMAYGYPLPNTAYLKLGPSEESIFGAISYLSSFLTLRPVFAVILLIGVVSLYLHRRSQTNLLFPFGIAIAYIGFVLLAGRDWMPHHRFIAPIVPLMAISLAAAFEISDQEFVQPSLVVLILVGIGFEVFMAYTIYKPINDEFGFFTNGSI
jgi:hypothetical protein